MTWIQHLTELVRCCTQNLQPRCLSLCVGIGVPCARFFNVRLLVRKYWVNTPWDILCFWRSRACSPNVSSRRSSRERRLGSMSSLL